MKQIILASQSPRRKDLLQQMGVEFEIVPSDFDEHLDDSRTTEEVAMELALGKAMDVATKHPDKYVIGSDTIVTVDGKQLGKPADLQEAHEMIKMLAGKSHFVTTGLAIVNLRAGIQIVEADSVTVHFLPYNEAAVVAYVVTGDPLDKAGGYGIQSGAAPLISHIEGHYDTVLGLQTWRLAKILTQFGIQSTPASIKSPVSQK